MPLPNYHACRVKDPDLFARIVVMKTLSDGIMIYGGPLKTNPGGPMTTQAYRFPKDKFTSAEARNWLVDNNVKFISFEPATTQESLQRGNLSYGADFTESIFDRESHTIKNVVLLGPDRKDQKRSYTIKCLIDSASMFENIQAFVDHPSLEEEKTGRRSVRNLAGKYVNAHFVDGKIKADAKLLPNENGKLYMDIAETMPDVAGNSQIADGLWRQEKNKQIVEQITKIYSVDLVASPATTHGMFESNSNNTGVQTMDWNEVTGALLLAHRPDVHEIILKEGQVSRDSEVSKLVEENKTLRLNVDGFELVEAANKKKTKVNELIEAEKLPKEAVTPTFVESLLTAEKDETIKALIDDRKRLYESAKGGVKNMGGTGVLKESQRVTQEQAKAALFG